MNKFITRAQELGKKAAELRQVVHNLPAQAAQIREAVTMTGGELKQLRADVQSNIQALRADTEDRLLRSMRELNDHTEIFEQAGYDLNGMDLDLGVNHRLAVHLDKFEDVADSDLRSLLTRQTSETVRSVLAGIIKAEETAANVELSHLVYHGLILHIGAIPMIRMCWRDPVASNETRELEPTAPVAHTHASQPMNTLHAPLPIAPPAIPAPKQHAESMFELRPLPGGAVRIESAPPSPPVPAIPAPQPVTEKGNAWSHDALERFKKMPGISKYGG